jgi:hypothetical protein
MFEILATPSLSFERIRNKRNQKIESYIKRLNKFWTLLVNLSEKEISNEEGVVKFKSTYIDKQKLIDAGFKEKTIRRYFLIFEEDGYITREYNTHNNGTRDIGHSLFLTLHPKPITPLRSKEENEKSFLENIVNSKIALVLNNLERAS